MQLSAVIVSFRSYFLLFPYQGQNTKIVLAPLSLRRKSGLSPWGKSEVETTVLS